MASYEALVIYPLLPHSEANYNRIETSPVVRGQFNSDLSQLCSFIAIEIIFY